MLENQAIKLGIFDYYKPNSSKEMTDVQFSIKTLSKKSIKITVKNLLPKTKLHLVPATKKSRDWIRSLSFFSSLKISTRPHPGAIRLLYIPWYGSSLKEQAKINNTLRSDHHVIIVSDKKEIPLSWPIAMNKNKKYVFEVGNSSFTLKHTVIAGLAALRNDDLDKFPDILTCPPDYCPSEPTSY